MRYFRIRILFILILTFIICEILLITKMKVCVCTIGKKENLYVREYVDYYKKMGIDKIFIYDNNEKNDEKFDLVLKDYIENGLVEIVDIRGKEAPQFEAMEDCRKKNFKNYDWLLFYDMDEFLFLRNFSNIKDFLKQKHFDKCQRIQLNWYIHTDNNLFYYDNRTLAQRFPEKKFATNGKILILSKVVKSMLRGNIDVNITGVHNLNFNLIGCNGFGQIKKISLTQTKEPDNYYYYIDHYWSKSTEEFVNKVNRGDVNQGFRNDKYNMERMYYYFLYNDIKKEKIDYIENKTKYNLTQFRLKIRK